MIQRLFRHPMIIWLAFAAALAGCATSRSAAPYQGSDILAVTELEDVLGITVRTNSGVSKFMSSPVALTGACYCNDTTCVRQDALVALWVHPDNDPETELGTILMAPFTLTTLAAICAVSETDRDHSGYCRGFNPNNWGRPNEVHNAAPVEVRTPLTSDSCPTDNEIFTQQTKPHHNRAAEPEAPNLETP